VVTAAGPHYLVADGALLSHRRTAAGDASEAGRTPSTPGVMPSASPVELGLPTVGVPASLPAATGCAL
jgi:tRNA-2-methylthio-N6-dimethylallyladenosine synthase